ncbi:MAG: transcriptional regulator GcvA [Candidimonas sp.]
MRRLPPLNPLRTFEAAARHENFARAAQELNVTQAAVSRQIMVLENVLDVRLFDRDHSSVRLTPAGVRYYEAAHQALGLLADATDELLRRNAYDTLNVQCYATFALRWLLPRLPDFNTQHPDCTVNLITSPLSIDFGMGNVDLAIHFGIPPLQGVGMDELLPDEMYPVCSPKLLRNGPPLRTPGDLGDYPFIYSFYRRDDWRTWLTAAGHKRLQPARRLMFQNSILSYQAAVEGLGLAMAHPALIQPELQQGTLIAPFTLRAKHTLAYHLVYPEKLRVPRKVAIFRNWILKKAAEPLSMG